MQQEAVPAEVRRKIEDILAEKHRQRRRLETKRAYRERNKERVAERKRKWRINNLDKERARSKRYRNRHPQKAAANRMARRARKQGLDHGDVTSEWLDALRAAQGDKCLVCRTALEGGGELDHLIPLKLSGPHARVNVALMCRPCNRSKHTKHPEDFVPASARWQHLLNWATATEALRDD